MWVKHLKLSRSVREVASFPLNKPKYQKLEWCNEAVVSVPEANLLHCSFGSCSNPDSVDSRLRLIEGAPLLACGVNGPRTEIQHDDISGWIDSSNIKVLQNRRPREIGFERKRICRSFTWPGTVLSETVLRRRSEKEIVEIERIPSGTTIAVVGREGNYFWVNHGSYWGYLEQSFVKLEGRIRAIPVLSQLPDDGTQTFRKVFHPTMSLQLETDDSGLHGSKAAVDIPPRTEFVLLDRIENRKGMWRAIYLGQRGSISPKGLKASGPSEPICVSIQEVSVGETLDNQGLR